MQWLLDKQRNGESAGCGCITAILLMFGLMLVRSYCQELCMTS